MLLEMKLQPYSGTQDGEWLCSMYHVITLLTFSEQAKYPVYHPLLLATLEKNIGKFPAYGMQLNKTSEFCQ
jgi:hypothetical protein